MPNAIIRQDFGRLIRRATAFFIIAALHAVVSVSVFARVNCPDQGRRLSADEYCRLYAEEAQRQMKKYGIPASITLAQGMFESGYGSSYIAVKGNNHFGIKAYHGWTGAVVRCDDDDRAEPFCKFSSVKEGYEYHSKFLRESTRYASLFKLSSTDYKGWAKGLQKCGYATNPKYPQLLIDVIERYNLAAYDRTSAKTLAKASDKKAAEKKSAQTASKSKSNSRSRGKASATIARPVQKSSQRLKYVVTTRMDNLSSLAKEFHLSERQLRNWNDLPKGYQLHEGEIVYLQGKREKSERAFPTHKVALGESLQGISQRYGVTVKSIVRRNKLSSATVQPGQVLKLR